MLWKQVIFSMINLDIYLSILFNKHASRYILLVVYSTVKVHNESAASSDSDPQRDNVRHSISASMQFAFAFFARLKIFYYIHSAYPFHYF